MVLDAKSKQVRREKILALVTQARANGQTPRDLEDPAIREVHDIVMEYPEITGWLVDDIPLWSFVLTCQTEFYRRGLK